MNRTYVYKRRWKRRVARAVDGLGAALVRHPEGAAAPAARRIVLVRLDHLGDVVCMLPLVEALARLEPRPHLATLTSTAGAVLLRDVATIDERLVYDAPWFARRYTGKSPAGVRSVVRTLRARGFDAAFELTGDARHHALLAWAGIPFRAGWGITGGGFLLHRELEWSPRRHAVDANLEFLATLGCPVEAGALPHLAWDSTPDETTWRERVGVGPDTILFHVDAGTAAKRWLPERWGGLVRQACERGARAVLVGADGRLSAALRPHLAGLPVRDLVGHTTLGQLVSALQSARAVVSTDSGPAHIAAALGKPVLVVWSGSNDPERWQPRGDVSLVRHPVPCEFCQERICPLRHHACMRDLMLDEVAPALEAFLDHAGARS